MVAKRAVSAGSVSGGAQTGPRGGNFYIAKSGAKVYGHLVAEYDKSGALSKVTEHETKEGAASHAATLTQGGGSAYALDSKSAAGKAALAIHRANEGAGKKKETRSERPSTARSARPGASRDS